MIWHRRLVTAVLAAAVAVVGLGSTALAEEIGGVYAAGEDGVLELSAASGRIVNTVSLAPAPTAVVFSPDGRQLYAAAGGRHLVRIDVESMTVAGRIPLAAAAAALAFPKGEQLVVAFASSRALGVVDTADDSVLQSPTLPGAVNLLAGDRRDERVMAAESGKGWLAVYNPTDRTLRKGSLAGGIVSLALDRRSGSGFVATRSPNRLYRVDLADLAVLWQADLSGAPGAVAALAEGPVVAAGKAMWTVDAAGPRPWAAARDPIGALAPSDDGQTLYAAQSRQVESFAGGRSIKVIVLAGVVSAVAALPRVSSIVGDGGSGTGRGGGAASIPNPDPGLLHPPDTSALVDAATRFLGNSPLPGAATLGGVILALCWLVIRWYERHGTVRG